MILPLDERPDDVVQADVVSSDGSRDGGRLHDGRRESIAPGDGVVDLPVADGLDLGPVKPDLGVDVGPGPDTGPKGPCDGTWSNLTNGLGVTDNLSGITCDGSTVVAVGAIGRIFRHNGTQWVQEPAPGPANLRAVWGSAGQAYAVGTGETIFHYTTAGLGWQTERSGKLGTLNAVYGTGLTNVYAVGSNSAILHHSGAGGWQADKTLGVTTNLEGVWATTGTVYVVGGLGSGGGVWVDRGGGWLNEYPTTAFMYDVWGTSANDVYAVGTGGLILHDDGSGWTVQSTPTTQALYAVWGDAKRTIAVGGPGIILCNDHSGSGWKQIHTAPGLLSDVWGCGGVVYAVGSGGTAVRFQ